MIVDVIRCASFLHIERLRTLPFPGQVLVEVGTAVNPTDIIAEAFVPSQVMRLDIARGLGLSAEETSSCLLRGKGDHLEKGDVIAQCEKTLPRLFRAPVDGKIIDYHQGQVVLSTGKEKFSLEANMIGSVQEIIPELGAVIATPGSLVQGVWGNSLSNSGPLHVANSSLDAPLEVSVLDDLEPGQVFAGGICLDAEVLDRCQEKEISGLILGALSSNLISRVKALTFPVILLQGFGVQVLSEEIFDLLKTNSGLQVFLNGKQTNKFSGERPEVIIPKTEGEPEKDLGFRKNLQVGDRVRLISGKMRGQSGKVVELFEGEQIFENGVKMPVALVKLKSLEKVKISQQNLLVTG